MFLYRVWHFAVFQRKFIPLSKIKYSTPILFVLEFNPIEK